MINRLPCHSLIPLLYLWFAVILLIAPNISHAESPATEAGDPVALGQEIYNLKGCSGCHKIAGAGGDLGPDLTNEGNIVFHDAEWHRRHFMDPPSLVPGSTMPKLGLTENELSALTAFMLSLRSEDLPKDVEGAIKMAHEKLDEARKGIDEIKKSGFNADHLEVKYVQGWTHLETINNMIYTHNLAGVYKETEEAVKTAKEILQEVLSYNKELEHRVIQTVVLIILIVIMVVLLFIKLLRV